MIEYKNRQQMMIMLDRMLDEELPYNDRLEAYEYLLEDCEPIVDDMLEKSYSLDGETGKMLMEVLAQYKGNKAIFMGLVSYLYKGEDVALFARLIGSYGDEKGVEILKNFCEEYEPDYNEYMEIRNAVEELGGDFDLKQDFTDDPLYRYLKGLDEPDDRRSPFEDILNPDEDDDDCDCHCHDDGCDDGEECNCHCHDFQDDCGDGCDCHNLDDAHSCDDGDCDCHNHRDFD